MVRRADYDRWFCSLFAPGGKREGLWLLYAFNHELARAREVAKGLLAQEVPREAMAAALLGVLARRRLGDVSRAFSVVDRAAVALAAVLGRL